MMGGLSGGAFVGFRALVAANRARCVVVLFFVCAMLVEVQADKFDGWRWGRGTFYGDRPWLWSIHEGNCGYGHLDYNQGTGWDVAALPDVHPEHGPSCGKCYEVKCEPMDFHDNFGNKLERKESCYDPNRTVILAVVDTCPCNYAHNSYSNKRWCCGDMDHFDLSFHTFDKLAPRKLGVIGLKYRPVECPGSFRLGDSYHNMGRKLKSTITGPNMYILEDEPHEARATVQMPQTYRID